MGAWPFVMSVSFDAWYTNCASTAAGRDRIRSLSTGEQYVKRYAIVAVVRLSSDTFQPYLSLIEFHAAKQEAKSITPFLYPPSVRSVAPSLPSQLPPQRTTLAEAMHASKNVSMDLTILSSDSYAIFFWMLKPSRKTIAGLKLLPIAKRFCLSTRKITTLFRC